MITFFIALILLAVCPEMFLLLSCTVGIGWILTGNITAFWVTTGCVLVALAAVLTYLCEHESLNKK